MLDSRQITIEDIISVVAEHRGIRIGELLWQVNRKWLQRDNGADRPNPEVVKILVNGLVEDKRLIEIEYSTDFTSMDSFLLPAKTAINIRGQENGPRRI